MRNKVLAVTMGLLIAGSAAAEGKEAPYLGLDLGWGNLNQTDFSNVFTGRLFAGYNFSDYLAAELGYTKFANSTFSTNFLGLNYTATLKTYAVDAVLKATLPLQYGFSLFGKLGAAYLNEQISDNIFSGSDTSDKVLPTFGLGAAYQFNQNLSGDVSWMHIQKVGSNTSVENTDFVGAGLTYNFG